MRTLLAAALAALAATGPALADEIGPLVARWQAGVVCPNEFGRGSNAANDISFIAQTQTVPAVVGMGFGVRAQTTVPEGLNGVTIVVDHPPFQVGGPVQQSYTTSMSGAGLSGFFYRFEEQREVQPGRWRISALSGSTVLYSLDFDVVIARQGDALLQSCGMQ